MPAKEAPRIQWLVEPTFDQDGVQATSGLDLMGREHPDPVPTAPPVGLDVPQTDELHTAIRNLMIRERALFQQAVEAEQFESEEEANDFITEDDVFPPGQEPWEDVFEFPVNSPGGAESEPSLASGPAKGGPAQQDAGPPSAPNGERVSSGLSPEQSMEKTDKMPIPGVRESGSRKVV